MSHFQPYSAYKDSGVEWLGQIPKHWNIIPLKWLFECLDGMRIPLNSEERSDIKGNIPYWGSGGVVDYIERHIFDEPLILLGEDGAPFFERDRPVAYAVEGESWINNHIHVLKPLNRYPLKWFVHVLNSVEYRLYINGSTRDKLTQDNMKNIAVSMPASVEEASSIVASLELETARIDGLVSKKTRFIELLREKRQALITHAVTKGIDPNVKMKDSGMEWLGDVPDHWGVKRIKYVKAETNNAFVDGPFGSNLKSEHFIDGGDVYVIESNFATQGKLVPEELKTITAEHFQTICRSEASEGDIIIAKIGAQFGKAAILPKLDKRSVVSGNSLKLTLNEKICLKDWAYWQLINLKNNGAIDDLAKGGAQPALSLGEMNNLPILTPSLYEQQVVIAHIERETMRIDKLVSQTERSIELLKERRSALITAAVTGQIDLREAA